MTNGLDLLFICAIFAFAFVGLPVLAGLWVTYRRHARLHELKPTHLPGYEIHLHEESQTPVEIHINGLDDSTDVPAAHVLQPGESLKPTSEIR